MFGSNKKRKDKIFNRFLQGEKEKEASFVVDINDKFEEQSHSAISQIKKTKLNLIDISENIKTSISPNSIFAIEILEESVTAAVVSRKGVFLDIKYLKRYRYEDLHIAYQNILKKEVEYDRNWYESLENIITIIFYETVHALPPEVVIIDNRLSDFHKVIIESSKFEDSKTTDNVLKKKFQAISGYSTEEVYMSIVKRPMQNVVNAGAVYAISMVEKEYFDSIERYLKDSNLVFKRFHSIHSSIYTSFLLEGTDSKLRVHINDNTAYIMEKNEENGFEYHQLDLNDDSEALMLMAYGVQETILSGYGTYYEEIKERFAHSNKEMIEFGNMRINIRSFSFVDDLDSCIIRLEKDIKLHSANANIISVAYHELFKVNLASKNVGVAKHLSVYDHIYNNLKALPFIILFLVAALTYGAYLYFTHKHNTLQKKHTSTAVLVENKKRLQKDIARFENNIRSTQQKIDKITNLFSMKTKSADAIILHEVAQKLPDDMILTKIEKIIINQNSISEKESIKITGKCFHEISLLNYIEDLNITNKRVFLISLEDTKKSKKTTESDSVFTTLAEENKRQYAITTNKNIPQIARVSDINDLNSTQPSPMPQVELSNAAIVRDYQKSKELDRLNLEEKMVYYSDTINNTFVLEIK